MSPRLKSRDQCPIKTK